MTEIKGLSQEAITALLTKPKRGGGKKATGPIPRDYENWFKLGAKMVDEATGELAECSNPNCQDPRATQSDQVKKGIVVAEVDGHLMCRICFLLGYGLPDPAQLTIGGENG